MKTPWATRRVYEVWPRKGDRPVCTFLTEGAAVAYVDARIQLVPGLRIEATTTITFRRVIDGAGAPSGGEV